MPSGGAVAVAGVHRRLVAATPSPLSDNRIYGP
jgi:hypothetical protein